MVFCLTLLFLILGSCSSILAGSRPQGSSVSAPKSIVLLYSYGDGLLAYQQATRAFLSIMEKGIKEGITSETSLFFEYLDLGRKKDKDHYKNLTTLLRHKYATQKIDLIVTVHGPALKFLLNEGRDLSPGTPVLSYLGPDTIETTGIARRFVLLPMSMDFRGTLQLAQKLFPRTMRVVFVNGTGEGEKRLEREAKSVFTQWPDQLEFEYTSDLNVEEMLQRMATLTPGTIVMYSNVFTDKTGRNFVARDVAERVAKAASVPVFGMYNTVIGKGILGGSVFHFEAEGTRAGLLALDILRGKLPLSEPTTILAKSRTPMFDWQQLKRWGVDTSGLPEGSMIVNRPPTVWGQYKAYIIAAIGFCLVQLLLIVWLLVQGHRRRSAEKFSRKSEAKYRNLFESMMDGYVLVGMDGRILEANDSYREMTGYSLDELLKLTYQDITPDKWHAVENEIIEQQVLVHGYSEIYEKEYRTKDGSLLPIELRTFLLKNETGNSTGLWAIVRDISGRKRVESETRRLKDDMAHITRVSTLSEFTSTLAHEINQPLAAILSNAQAAQRFLSQDKPDMREIGEILGDIVRDSNRAAGVIRKVQPMLKKEAIRHESLSLNETIEEVLHILGNDGAFAGVSIAREFDTSLPVIWGDRIQLQQVVMNLVLNAADAMGEKDPDLRRLILRTSRQDDRFALVSVRDFGPGIQKDVMDRIFDPFFTTKSSGLGVGLAISKDIVKFHNGEIRAVNNPDTGVTVSFTVPFESGVMP